MRTHRFSMYIFFVLLVCFSGLQAVADGKALPGLLQLLLTSEDKVSRLIEADNGGTLSLESGVSITIPPHALSQDTTITLTGFSAADFDANPTESGVANLHLLGAVFEPEGTVFSIPATVRMPLPADWSTDDELVLSGTNGNNPDDMMATTVEVVITGSFGNYIAEFQTSHFSGLGLSRNCHSGTYRRVVDALKRQGCTEDQIKKQVKDLYGVDINADDAEHMDNNHIQPFLSTYLEEYITLDKDASLTQEDIDYLQSLAAEGLQVVIAFTTADSWPGANPPDGFYPSFPHSAMLEPDGSIRHVLEQNPYLKKERESLMDKMQKEMADDGTISYTDPLENINDFRQQPNGKAFREFLEKMGVFSQQDLDKVVQSNTSYDSIKIYIDQRDDPSQNPCECSLSLSPEKSIPGQDIFAEISVPKAMNPGTIECNTTAGNSFSMPLPLEHNKSKQIFQVPADFTGDSITASCLVTGRAGEMCTASDSVEIAQGGPCALQGLPGPEVVTYGVGASEREWQRCGVGGVRFDCLPYAANYCQNLTLSGRSDWRLPTKDELKGLVVCSNNTPTPLEDPPTMGGGHPYHCGDGTNDNYDIPTIDPIFYCPPHNANVNPFPGHYPNNMYWTATPYETYKHNVVYFYNGQTEWAELLSDENDNDGNICDIRSYFVRCVRDITDNN